MKKKVWRSAKAGRKNHEILVANLTKIDEKNAENGGGSKNRPKSRSWDAFLSKQIDFGSILGPWGGHWEGLGKDFGKKIWDRKKNKKKDGKLMASAGSAEGGKEGLDGWTGKI